VLNVRNWTIETLRLVRFGLVGIIATAVYSLATLLAIEALGFSPIAGSLIGVMASSWVSYFGHALYSFKVTIDHATFLWRFLAISGASLAMSTGVMWLFTDFLNVSHRLAIAILVVLIPATNYICNRFWVFRPGLSDTISGPASVLTRNSRDFP
jgi:putative flippase GtrA